MSGPGHRVTGPRSRPGLFAALSAVCSTITIVPVRRWRRSTPGRWCRIPAWPLTRATTFRFTLDPSREQELRLLAHAGAARLAYNHHLGRVRANLDQRAAERALRDRGGRPDPGAVVVEGVVHQPHELLEGRPRTRRPRVATTTTATRSAVCRGGTRSRRTSSSARRSTRRRRSRTGRSPAPANEPGRLPGSRGSSPATRPPPRSGYAQSTPKASRVAGPPDRTADDPASRSSANCGSTSTPARSRSC